MKYLKIYNIFIILILANYGANMYNCGLKPICQQSKWVLLTIMLFVLLTRVKSDYRYFSINPLASLSIISFLITSLIFAFFYSINLNTSILFICGLLLIFAVSYKLANYFSYPEFRWNFFETLLLLARLITYSNFLMLLLGINKGRGGERFAGWTFSPNTLTMMIVPLFPVVLYYAINRKSINIWSERVMLIMMSAMFIAAGTRGAALGVICSSIVILWFSKKWRKILISITIIVIFTFILSDKLHIYEMESFKAFKRYESQEGAWGTGKWGSGREEIWKFTIDLIKEEPWVGYGVGSNQKLVKLAQDMGVIHYFQGGNTHNSYLTILVETGIIGFVPIFFVLIFALSRIFGTLKYIEGGGRDPFVIILAAIALGCMVNAAFETWMISPGNMNALIFWGTVFFLLGYRRDVGLQEIYTTKQ